MLIKIIPRAWLPLPDTKASLGVVLLQVVLRLVFQRAPALVPEGHCEVLPDVLYYFRLPFLNLLLRVAAFKPPCLFNN